MALNEGSINGFSLNASPRLGVYLEDLNEILHYSEALSFQEVLSLIDTISFNVTEISTSLTSDSISESYILLDKILVSIREDLLNSYELSDVEISILKRITLVLDSFSLSEETLVLATFRSNLIEALSIIDDGKYGVFKEILESMLVSDSLDNISILINILSDLATLSDVLDSNSLFLRSVSDTFSLDDLSDTTALFNHLLLDDIIITVGADNSPEYISYLLSPETFSVTTYNNYNFTGSCKFFHDYIFINEDGLYKYGGDLDVENIIQAEIETAALSFGTSSLKQLPNFYLGLSNSNKIVLKVRVDGKAEVHYKLNKKTENLQTQLIPLGKGLIGRYFQFELITQENTLFEVDSMEFMPLVFKRKL